MWLNLLVDEHHFGNITKLKMKKIKNKKITLSLVPVFFFPNFVRYWTGDHHKRA
jgi:hypothetical protein